MKTSQQLFERRKRRVRLVLRKKNSGRPRLTVFRSNKHIYAQVIDDTKGTTLVSASTLDKDVREQVKSGSDIDAAAKVGTFVAERAKAAGITDVVFDRGGYQFHGRVKALGDAAREAGLTF